MGNEVNQIIHVRERPEGEENSGQTPDDEGYALVIKQGQPITWTKEVPPIKNDIPKKWNFKKNAFDL